METSNPVEASPKILEFTNRNGKQRFKPSAALLMELDSDMLGFCIACGASDQFAEPDAEKYTCESCDKPAVYGAGGLALRGYCF